MGSRVHGSEVQGFVVSKSSDHFIFYLIAVIELRSSSGITTIRNTSCTPAKELKMTFLLFAVILLTFEP